jgi:hypothetical protein
MLEKILSNPSLAGGVHAPPFMTASLCSLPVALPLLFLIPDP